jgi:RHS repeat-associated protein
MPTVQPRGYSYDALGRVLCTTIKDSNNVLYSSVCDSYNDGAPSSSTHTVKQDSTHNITTESKLDGYGRLQESSLTSDPSGADYTDITYDPLGRKQSVSNPYRSTSDPSYGITSYMYDALGRMIAQCQPDNTASPATTCQPANSYLKWGYAGNLTDFYDETLRHWQRTSDALGRLTKVLEPNGSTNITATPTLETDYQYTAFGDLTKVSQSGLVRTFTYDGLSRLLTASNPESGTVCYGVVSGSSCVNGYDANSNLVYRTDARGIQTTYTYDALNRLTAKTYSDATPPAHFNYDETTVTVGNNFWSGPYTLHNGIGRMTSWYVGTTEPGLAMKTFTYDSAGRPLQSQQCWGTTECGSTYGTRQNHRTYDLAGDVTTIDNSTDASVAFTYDEAGRVASATYGYAYPTLGSIPLIASATYTAFGQPLTRDGIEIWGYDKRLRSSSYTAKSSPNSSIVNYGYSLTYQTNGDLQAATETSGSKSWTWNYTYDNLNRLYTATNAQLVEGCQESYDVYGNRNSQEPYGGPNYACSWFTASFTGNNSANNNRIDGYCYDAAGNLLDQGPCPASGNHTYTYDGEGRMATAQNGTTVITYGADGLLTTAQVSGTPYNYVYDYDGSIIAHYGNSTTLRGPSQEIWVNGRHFGYVTTNGSTVPPVVTVSGTDWLGTERAHIDQAGNLQATFCSFPFGEALTTCAGSDPSPDPTFFTGKERDQVSGLDNFGARYYGSNMGRWMSPDPLMANDLRLLNPQRWNMYGYAINNPLTFTDPTGKDAILVTFTNEVPGVGHAGMIAVQRDGTATYSRFGPQGTSMGMGSPSSSGVSPQPISLPTVQFGSDGLPTPESYSKLTNAAAVQENQSSGFVVMNYFKTSDAETSSLLEYMKQGAAHPNGPYEFLGNNCQNYCDRGLNAAGQGMFVNAQQYFNPLAVPNLAAIFYSFFANDTYVERAPRYEVTHKIIYDPQN